MATKTFTAVNINVWNMNGGDVPEEAVKKVERVVEKVLADYDKHEGIRLLTQTTRA